MTDLNTNLKTCSECLSCTNCQQPLNNNPWVFLGYCLKWDSAFCEKNGWTNGVNVATLLDFIARNPCNLIWNYSCDQCEKEENNTKSRTVVVMDMHQLKNVLDTEELLKVLRLN